MKKILARLALISFALITAACGNKGSSSEASSSVEPSISSDTSTPSSNSLTPSSSDPKIVDNQLSAANGLKVYLKNKALESIKSNLMENKSQKMVLPLVELLIVLPVVDLP